MGGSIAVVVGERKNDGSGGGEEIKIQNKRKTYCQLIINSQWGKY